MKAAIPDGEELLICFDAVPGADVYCEVAHGGCGRRLFSTEAAPDFTGTLSLELRCPRCPAKVVARIVATA